MEKLPSSNLLNDFSYILQECPVNNTGVYELDSYQVNNLERILINSHLVLPEPDQSLIQTGITRACQLREAETIGDRLFSFEFLSESSFKIMIAEVPPTNVWLEKSLYADPDKIRGAVTFTSWMGRGKYGQGEVAIRERSGKRSSFEQIIDYATRESQLPYLSNDGGMNLIITHDVVFFFSSNAHRAAAAKLRQEPLGFRRLSVYNTTH